MFANNRPRVSIAIPLYRSKRFLRVIGCNLRRIDLPDAEILISDRHGDDDALLHLQAEFGHDPRIRFLQFTDRIGWVDHYNELLKQATGRYFMWMPHDDSFPRFYLPTLLADLERNPSLWLVFGTLYSVYRQPHRVEIVRLPAWQKRTSWSHWSSLRWFLTWNLGSPMRGLFDRERVIAHNLWLKPVWPTNRYADVYWLFGLGLKGQMHYNSSVCTVKRMYADSTSAVWKHSDYVHPNGLRTLFSYIAEARLHGIASISLPILLAIYSAVYQVVARTLFRWLPGFRQALLHGLFKQTRTPARVKNKPTRRTVRTNRQFPTKPQSRL